MQGQYVRLRRENHLSESVWWRFCQKCDRNGVILWCRGVVLTLAGRLLFRSRVHQGPQRGAVYTGGAGGRDSRKLLAWTCDQRVPNQRDLGLGPCPLLSSMGLLRGSSDDPGGLPEHLRALWRSIGCEHWNDSCYGPAEAAAGRSMAAALGLLRYSEMARQHVDLHDWHREVLMPHIQV